MLKRPGLTIYPRNFLTKSYPTMKKHNPHTPIMIREASGTEPTVYARFGASPLEEKRIGANTRKSRLWQGEEATTQGTGRQGDRTKGYRPRTIENIRKQGPWRGKIHQKSQIQP
jgi:hypothetical protein